MEVSYAVHADGVQAETLGVVLASRAYPVAKVVARLGCGGNLAMQQSRQLVISSGQHYPLGATLGPRGVNFSLYSQHAKQVFLLLFDRAAGALTHTIEIQSRTKFIWHVFVEGLTAGQLYAYRVGGDFDPANGMRFNVNKV